MSNALPRLVVRADGNARIGLGHVVRSMAVADIVRDEFAEVLVAVAEPLPALGALVTAAGFTLCPLPTASAAALLAQLRPTDVVMLDGLAFDTDYQRAVRAVGCRVVVVDDLHAYRMEADLIINHGPEATPALYKARPGTRYCLGPGFTMVRREFREAAQRPWPVPQANSVLVCFGGADPQQFTHATLQALLRIDSVRAVGVVTGAAYQHGPALHALAAAQPDKQVQFYQQLSAADMVRLLTDYAVVVCPASTVLLETLVLGQAAITGYYVPDQQVLAGFVHRHQQAFSVGDFRQLRQTDFEPLLRQGLRFHETTLRQPYVPQLTPEVLQAEFRRLRPA
ncbi:UDP-2,4-diacetamido-2,4,6-trideoxy-beta-L-altropyranose hydrolase [Hymenobacter sp. 15J16-1T3B]|uniref:UDP-2,4-diacetamido-2,4, 6-trideoxy-beta-L-altropyranose hydrolase n=1 Tax=Hymenobacter sp. 15J16-1T3B TaxID=2886941 RepID=UPI001D109D95|nr:UDP-2,4-diacetamido-2,4,6-trideoxy-beta-L-altropyranose hydrolase [Hymenobacter sp. 15J16-1T3B]MCC3159403.1 UDP-2,4-diacetamido-2,4,6-trideoxy-beta-L-altropyranose hydrolase [Hymenobacter sp. 15J16-1T3B]